MTVSTTETAKRGESNPARQRIGLHGPITWQVLIASAHLLTILLIAVVWSPFLALPYAIGCGLFYGWRLKKRQERAGRIPVLRFTSEGRYVVVITIGVGLAAINTGNNLLYLFLGMMLSMIIVSGVLSELTLNRLKVVRTIPKFVVVGQPFLTGISLHNQKKRLPSFSVQVDDLLSSRPTAKKCYFLKVPPGATQRTSYRTEVKERGLHRYSGTRLVTRFPFAFFVKERHFPYPADLIAYPRISPMDEFPFDLCGGMGDVNQSRQGQGREFHALRDHRVGDDSRDIYWKRLARDGRLMLREYQDESARIVLLVLNHQLPAHEDPRGEAAERCIEVTASLATHFHELGYQVELCSRDENWRLDTTGTSYHSVMRWLALFELKAGTNHNPWTPLPSFGQVILISHEATAALVDVPQDAIQMLQGGHQR